LPNVRLVIEYDGSRFHGWQKQPGLRTIQEELQGKLSLVLREEIPYLLAAGRTDAGVHARGQVVNFPVASPPDLRRLIYSVSGLFRGELAVLRADLVPDDFHATRSSDCKQYTYTILNRPAGPVIDKGHIWHVSSPLNVEKMIHAAQVLVGAHDFSSFRAAHCNSRSPIREVFESEVSRDGCYIRYRVIGSGFLKQMVRNIVGTLVSIGLGRGGSMPEILAARDRRHAGMTAPPQGLCMDWVEYRDFPYAAKE
jgi:tRNA pseudouridine38-40 synthase